LPAAESRPGAAVLSKPSPSEPRPPNGSADDVGNMADGGGNNEKALDMCGKTPVDAEDRAAAYCEKPET